MIVIPFLDREDTSALVRVSLLLSFSEITGQLKGDATKHLSRRRRSIISLLWHIKQRY